jgi:hypothetical protein
MPDSFEVELKGNERGPLCGYRPAKSIIICIRDGMMCG